MKQNEIYNQRNIENQIIVRNETKKINKYGKYITKVHIQNTGGKIYNIKKLN